MNAKKELLQLGFRDWDGKGLLLIPLKLFKYIPDGTILTSINGKEKIKGREQIDDDTRCGLLAYGIMPRLYEKILKVMEK